MASKKKGSLKKAPKKTISQVINSLDTAVVVLMLAGFIIGFLLYLFLIGVAPLDASTAVSIENVQFFREQGEIRFLLSSHEGASNACQAVVTFSSGGVLVFQKSIDVGILRPYANRTVSFLADVPEGKFDYDIEVSCNTVADE